MGRQVQVALSDDDETDFLTFLRESADIQLLRSSAPTPDQIFVDKFAAREEGHWQYFVWNKGFPWKPEFRTVAADAPVIERRGWAYVSNSGIAPVLEYDRHNFSARGVTGRIYWAKYFSASNGLAYDVHAFERWYMSIARWLRKRGRRRADDPQGLLYLPQAWARYGTTA
jgi:hypothetical protein